MIRILIVEDNWVTSEELKEVLVRNGMEVIGQADNASDALEVVEKNEVDIAVLDIDINGDIDGVALAEKITNMRTLAIIFLTAYDDSQQVERAKKVVPAAYIAKPFQPRNIILSIEIAFNNLIRSIDQQSDKSATSDFLLDDRIFVKEGGLLVKLNVEEINYVEAVGSYCKVNVGQKDYTLSINLKTFENKLGKKEFLRVHRSFLVNCTKIDAINGNSIYLDKIRIPIGLTQRSEVLKRVKIV